MNGECLSSQHSLRLLWRISEVDAFARRALAEGAHGPLKGAFDLAQATSLASYLATSNIAFMIALFSRPLAGVAIFGFVVMHRHGRMLVA